MWFYCDVTWCLITRFRQDLSYRSPLNPPVSLSVLSTNIRLLARQRAEELPLSGQCVLTRCPAIRHRRILKVYSLLRPRFLSSRYKVDSSSLLSSTEKLDNTFSCRVKLRTWCSRQSKCCRPLDCPYASGCITTNFNILIASFPSSKECTSSHLLYLSAITLTRLLKP
jgi:hypothetical protein